MVRSLASMTAMAGCLTAGLATGTATANPVKSLYTTIDLNACKRIRQETEGGAAWLCDGLPGSPVFFAEGDAREFVSVGADAEKRRAAKQTLRPSNSIFEKGTNRATVEWRFNRRGERKLPYAIIVRFHTLRDGRKGDVLVVSKVSDTETCHMAYIDARANNNAIALARHVADTQAKAFDCRKGPITEGARGKSPM